MPEEFWVLLVVRCLTAIAVGCAMSMAFMLLTERYGAALPLAAITVVCGLVAMIGAHSSMR